MRLPMNPSQLPASTGTLPSVRASAMTVASVWGEVFAPRTFSMSFITCAGLKKCVPMTCCGREVAAAIRSISSVEVLVARMACSGAWRSSSAKMRRLSCGSSNTASMTISTVERAS